MRHIKVEVAMDWQVIGILIKIDIMPHVTMFYTSTNVSQPSHGCSAT